MERLPPLNVSQYGIGIDASTGVERRFMTVTSGVLSVNVSLSKEDWGLLVQMAEARLAKEATAKHPSQELEAEAPKSPFDAY